jgi:hypothetical protein
MGWHQTANFRSRIRATGIIKEQSNVIKEVEKR